MKSTVITATTTYILPELLNASAISTFSFAKAFMENNKAKSIVNIFFMFFFLVNLIVLIFDFSNPISQCHYPGSC